MNTECVLIFFLQLLYETFPIRRETQRDIFKNVSTSLGTAVAQWLRCCAINRKVAGSIPDGIIGIFH